MLNLTDTQLVILTAAARREGGSFLPLPRRIKLDAAAASDLLKSLIRRKLAAERPANASEAGWRETPEGERIALMITGAGLKAIGVEPEKTTSSGTAKPRATAKAPRSSARLPRAGKPQRGAVGPGPGPAASRKPSLASCSGPKAPRSKRWPRRPAGRATPCGASCPAP